MAPGFGIAEPLNWRSLIDGAKLTGPLRMMATQGQVMAYDENRVQLRLSVSALATAQNQKRLSEALSRHLGRPFRVELESGETDEGSTVADAERAERAAQRAKLIADFKNDPLVQEVCRLFGGVVDEQSIRPIGPEQK